MDNQTMMQYFEWYLPADGLLWKRTAAQAPKLKEAGIDLLWLPPAYKGAGGRQDTGYGVYDPYDLGEFDQKGTVATKYGTAAEYVAAVKAVQNAGISVLGDIVMNQRMGADETENIRAVQVDPNNRQNPISGEEEVEVWTKYICPGRAGKYSPFQWDWMCFTGVDFDQRTGRKGVFRFSGKEWSPFVSGELGNYDYLMGCDVDVNHPETGAELRRWGQWYIDKTGVDGLRLDAVKHIDHKFVGDWLHFLREKTGKELFAVAEFWSGDLAQLKEFLDNCENCLSLFDVPLHMHFHEASTSRGGYDMGRLLLDTLVGTDMHNAVTFVDNHDCQPGQSLESWVDEWFKPLAYAVILLRKDGLPCVFYADYYGMRGDAVPPVPGIKRMLQVRKHYAYGEQHDYFDDNNIVGWTREGDEEHENSGCAVLITDGEGGEKNMYIGKQFAGRVFRDVIRRLQEPVVVDENGNATFKVTGGGVCVWVPEQAYEDLVVNFD